MAITLSRADLATMDFSAYPQTQEFPAMQFYPHEWLVGASVQAMTAEQTGAFINLLAQAWIQGPPCSLPDDSNIFAGYARVGGRKRWDKMGAFVREQFVMCADGRLRNAKQVSVWLAMLDLRFKRRNSRNGVPTKDAACHDKLDDLSSPPIGEERRGTLVPVEPRQEPEGVQGEPRRPPSAPDFAAAERLSHKLENAGLQYPPSDQVVIAWLSEFDEALIVETLADCEAQYRGKHYHYLEQILRSRRDNPNTRPTNRLRRGAPGTNQGATTSGKRTPRSFAGNE